MRFLDTNPICQCTDYWHCDPLLPVRLLAFSPSVPAFFSLPSLPFHAVAYLKGEWVYPAPHSSKIWSLRFVEKRYEMSKKGFCKTLKGVVQNYVRDCSPTPITRALDMPLFTFPCVFFSCPSFLTIWGSIVENRSCDEDFCFSYFKI